MKFHIGYMVSTLFVRLDRFILIFVCILKRLTGRTQYYRTYGTFRDRFWDYSSTDPRDIDQFAQVIESKCDYIR